MKSHENIYLSTLYKLIKHVVVRQCITCSLFDCWCVCTYLARDLNNYLSNNVDSVVFVGDDIINIQSILRRVRFIKKEKYPSFDENIPLRIRQTEGEVAFLTCIVKDIVNESVRNFPDSIQKVRVIKLMKGLIVCS